MESITSPWRHFAIVCMEMTAMTKARLAEMSRAADRLSCPRAIVNRKAWAVSPSAGTCHIIVSKAVRRLVITGYTANITALMASLLADVIRSESPGTLEDLLVISKSITAKIDEVHQRIGGGGWGWLTEVAS